MKNNNEYEEIDKAIAKAVLTTTYEGEVFFINDIGMSTRFSEKARVFKDLHDAHSHGIEINKSQTWQLFKIIWEARHLVGDQVVELMAK